MRERESFTLQNETDNATLYRVIQIIQSWGSSLNFFNHWPKSNNFIWLQVSSEYEMLVPTYQFPSECWYWHIWLFQWGFYFLCMVYADVFLGLCTSWLVQSQWCTQDSPSFQVPSKSCLAWYPGGWNFYNEHTLFCWSKNKQNWSNKLIFILYQWKFNMLHPGNSAPHRINLSMYKKQWEV